MTIARASIAKHRLSIPCTSMGPRIVAIWMNRHYEFSFFNTVSPAFLTVYLSRRVVHVSEFKEWKSEPVNQKTSPTPGRARCT
jgi:hypothetical protein